MHLRRLNELQVPHTDPIKISSEGDEGTAIYWEDPEHNQFEFWAPTHMPAGMMDGPWSLNVGRLSHVVFECRDTGRTTDFVTTVFGIDPIHSADVDEDTVAFATGAGGRIVYKKVDELGERAGRMSSACHTALTVRADEYLTNYKRIWEALPEFEPDQAPGADPSTLPASTALHTSLAGKSCKKHFGRGDYIYDWDMNPFHLVGGVSKNNVQTYRSRFMDHYIRQILGDQPGATTRELLDVMDGEEARGEWDEVLFLSPRLVGLIP